MRKTAGVLSATAAGGLLLAGVVTATSHTAGHVFVHANRAAYTTTSAAVSLDNCPTLLVGAQGDCVSQLETELNELDNAGLSVDGIFGSATYQAVIKFQQNRGLTQVDGRVGPEVKQALDDALDAAPPSPVPTSSQGGPDCLNQATTGHCYAITEYTPPAGTVGVHLAFPFLPMHTGGSSLGNGDYHVNNTLFAIFPGDNNYMEAGVSDAFAPPNNWNNAVNGSCPNKECISYSYDSAAASESPGCAANGCGAYFLYWADHNQVAGVDYNHIHIVYFVSPSFSPPTEYVDILWNYHNDNQWALNFTGDVTASDESTIDDAWHAPSTIEAGLEVSAPAGAADCATYNISEVGVWSHGSSWQISWPNTPAAAENTNDYRIGYGGTINKSGRYSAQLNNGYNGC
jgi:peptidoglycan hydrolase-like protein with peptidoglycan-binding domain